MPWFKSPAIKSVVSPLFDDSMLLRKYHLGNYASTALIFTYLRRLYLMATANKFDLIWIEKEALPWLPIWIEKWFLQKRSYILDYDDAIFHNYDLHRFSLVRFFYGRKIDHLMEGSRLVIVGNRYLASRAIAAGARWVEVIPTVVDISRYSPKNNYSFFSNLHIVWIGSPSTAHYLFELKDSLSQLAQFYSFTLRVIGAGSISIPGVNVEIFSWSLDTEAALIGDCDIGIMPLKDTPWEQGKCAYKLIQYMACGLPVVASPIGENLNVVINGETGFFANSKASWIAQLEILLKDATLRKRFGDRGRLRVEAEYSLNKTAPQLLHFLKVAASS